MDEQKEQIVAQTQTQQFVEQEDEGFTFKMLFGFVKRVFPMVVVWLLAAIILAVGSGFIANVALNKNKVVQSIVKFNFDGIDKGVDPAGIQFDANSIKNSANISETMTAMGLNEQYTNAGMIADAITVTGIVPENIVKQLALLQKLDTKDTAVLEQIAKLEYYSTRFAVTFNFSKLTPKMAEKTAIQFIDLLLKQYLTYFENKYAKAEVFSADLYSTDILLSNDYIEAYDIYKGEFDIINSYLSDIAAKAGDFRSDETNLKITDLIQKLKPIYASLYNYEAFVAGNGVTKEQGATVNYLKMLKQKYVNKLDAATTQIAELNKQIAEYKIPSIIINDGANVDLTEIVTRAYDEMHLRVAGLTAAKASYAEEMANIDDRIIKYEHSEGGVAITPEKMKENMAIAQGKLNSINTSMKTLISITNKTVLDYNNKKVVYNAMRTESQPGLVNNVVFPINWTLVLVIGAAVGLIGGIACGQLVYVYKNKNKAEKAKQ